MVSFFAALFAAALVALSSYSTCRFSVVTDSFFGFFCQKFRVAAASTTATLRGALCLAFFDLAEALASFETTLFGVTFVAGTENHLLVAHIFAGVMTLSFDTVGKAHMVSERTANVTATVEPCVA